MSIALSARIACKIRVNRFIRFVCLFVDASFDSVASSLLNRSADPPRPRLPLGFVVDLTFFFVIVVSILFLSIFAFIFIIDYYRLVAVVVFAEQEEKFISKRMPN